ncbi:hypothetical protein HPC49_25595 [Pyxidicoccus fallax]|uniref:Lipoprotein n=1 Tax=Pyxidicoccus fallax TaxID=394095 RepID=A0A848LF61_9BACT|nr:hypothetical protein [Pyxidicoccus fallax]NMO15515.1 hypothetical protein [Pyxidicoccus fallax]NPC81587.1 hypothetical protein [Pyxidicoccus fallax]
MAARLLLLLVLLQCGCLAESALNEADLQCGPRDLTVECCLKKNPGQWEKCTGTPNPGESGVSEEVKRKLMQGAAAGTAVAVALQPRFNSAEQRGVELAADLHATVEKAIWRCVRGAEQEARDAFFGGRSPTAEQCRQLTMPGQTWAMFLGRHKHKVVKPCLHAALGKLLPGRYLLEPRFQFNERTGQWEYLDKKTEDQLVSNLGVIALEGSIAPDIVLMDGEGVIIHVYDMKFPCPDSNPAGWSIYRSGRWTGDRQDELYLAALHVRPRIVSPRDGVERPKR